MRTIQAGTTLARRTHGSERCRKELTRCAEDDGDGVEETLQARAGVIDAVEEMREDVWLHQGADTEREGRSEYEPVATRPAEV